MRKLIPCFTLLTALFSLPLSAQQGAIAGKIIDKKDGGELIGANVLIKDSSLGASTDIEGRYSISVDPGHYVVLLSYVSYKNEEIEVDVRPGQVTYLDFAMEENSTDLQEVVVTYAARKSSSLALLIERKNAATVSDGVSAELIRRTPDRTTSDVLKRVTGASIQEGKFAVIRGMNDRYNAGYLDGALLPSTESDRKAFAFDVVPATLIDNLQIIKAGAPDLIGDFGGGIIRINTKSIPESFTQSLSIGGQVNSLTQFRDFTQFRRYPGESFNFLGGQRDFPNFADGALKTVNTFPTAEEKQRLAINSQGFNHDWSNEVVQAPVNSRFTYSLGLPIKLSGTQKMGLILALNYANTRRYSENLINTYDGSGQVSALRDQASLQNISSGGILNLNYVASKTQISFRNILNVNTDNNVVLRSGTGNITDAVEVRNTANLINYNRLYNTILSLRQVVGDNLFKLSVSANYSDVRRRLPDYRIVSYTKTPDEEDYRLALGDFFNTSTGRFMSDLKERLYGGQIDLEKDVNGRLFRANLKAGVFYQQRERDFYGRSFVYNGNPPASLSFDPAEDLAADKISAGRLYLLEKTSDDIGYYNGSQNLMAGYVAADQKIGSRLRMLYGVRYENTDIEVTNDKIGADIARIRQGVLLPSANLSYSLGSKANLRAAYYASVNRPEFRELAPFSFYVFDKNAEIRGNSDLKIAQLNNYDLRLELFPSGNQVLSVGAFYKSIRNPVEFSIDVTQPFTTFTFENEKSATIYGLELEARKSLDFIAPEKPFWGDITVFSNFSLIRSELQFGLGSQAKAGRPLQGQSPYVLNAGIQYENEESGWFSSLVVNRIGRRIAFVGVDPQFGDTRQDIYEAPRTVLDFQAGRNIGKWNLRMTVGDLLRQNLLFYQDADQSGRYNAAGDRLMFQYLNGYTLSLSAGYTF